MSSITLFRERLRTRSLVHGAYRLLNIFKNYGFTCDHFCNLLDRYVKFLSHHNVRPTFPVTAFTVHRHPDLFRKLQDSGVEFAIHGYRHMDYTQLEAAIVRSHLEKAIRVFKENRIQYHGFRFPFLRRNPESTKVVSEFDFSWESSEVISWPIPVSPAVDHVRLRDVQKLLHSYHVKSSEELASLPCSFHGCLEIPVSIPDDDLLIERLNAEESCIRTIWFSMLESTVERKEILVLQLHPERFFAFRSVLRDVIYRAQHRRDVWIAPLQDISAWWHERAGHAVDLHRKSGNWVADPVGNSRIAFETGETKKQPVRREWRAVNGLCIRSKNKPVIGLRAPVPHEIIDILNQEGYLFENADNDRYNLLINEPDLKSGESLIRKIEGCDYPLIRKKRWPYPYQSSLSVTGDIDGIDFWDYWTRFYGK